MKENKEIIRNFKKSDDVSQYVTQLNLTEYEEKVNLDELTLQFRLQNNKSNVYLEKW